MRHVAVSDLSKLQLLIYVLGYSPMGESMFVVVRDSNNQEVYQSLLIDCFEVNDKNEFEPFFKQFKIDKNKLDFVIWTHPDYDHSVGFCKIIQKYTSKDTLFILPEGFTKNLFLSRKLQTIYSYLSLIFQRKLRVERVNSSNKRKYPTVYGDTEYSDGINDCIQFNFEILTPFADQVFYKTELLKRVKMNDISISLILQFGGQNFYFGGDTEDCAIKSINPEKMHNIIFIKIPHHSSKTSIYLPKLLQNNYNESGNMKECIVSVTTCFKKNKINLPDITVLDEYKKCVGKILKTNCEAGINLYGIWEFEYNIRPQIIKPPIAYGDAVEYYNCSNANRGK